MSIYVKIITGIKIKEAGELIIADRNKDKVMGPEW